MTTNERSGSTQACYRDSHLGEAKANAYDRGFLDPASAKGIAWEIERGLLDGLIAARRPHGAVDFACGTGRVLAHLERRVADCTGVDVSPEMLALASRRCHVARLVRADVTLGEQVELAHPVQLVTALRFFLNAEPELRRRALAWIRSTLAPGGVLVANFHLNPHSARGAYLRSRRVPGLRTLAPRAASALLAEGGFEVIGRHGYDFLPYRREGDRLILPSSRRRIERLLASRAPVGTAGTFLLVARPAGGV